MLKAFSILDKTAEQQADIEKEVMRCHLFIFKHTGGPTVSDRHLVVDRDAEVGAIHPSIHPSLPLTIPVDPSSESVGLSKEQIDGCAERGQLMRRLSELNSERVVGHIFPWGNEKHWAEKEKRTDGWQRFGGDEGIASTQRAYNAM